MANFNSLKQTIQNYIKQNGNKEITGNLLQEILLSMVTTMGDGAINDNASDISDIQNEIQNIITTRLNTGALYAGYATPSTTPAALTSQEVFYLATQAGTYTNFHFNGSNDPIVLTKDGIYFIVSGDDDDDWNAEPMLLLDDEPTAGSDNLPKSRGCIASIGEGSFIKNFNVTKSGSTTLNTGTYIDFALDKYYKIFCRSTDNKVSYINVVIVLGTNNYQVITVPNDGYIIFKSKKTVQSCVIQNEETIDGTDNVTLSFYSLNDASKEVQLFLLGELTQTIDSKPTKSSKNLVYSGGVAIEDEAINSKFFLSSSYSGLVADTGNGYISSASGQLNSFVYPVVEGKTYSMAGFNALNNKAMFTNNVPQVGNIALLVDIIDGKVTVPDGYAYMLIDVNVPSINDLNYCFVYIESPLGNEVVKLINTSNRLSQEESVINAKLFLPSSYSGIVADTGTGYISASTETLNSFVYPVIEGQTYTIYGFSALNAKALFTKGSPQVGDTAVILSIVDGKVTVPNGYSFMLIDIYTPNIVDVNRCLVFIESPLGNYVLGLLPKYKVSYSWKDFPAYGLWVDGLAYDTGVNSFHSDLIPLDKAKKVNIKTAIATSFKAYMVLNEDYDVIASQTPVDTNLHTYTFDVTSGMKYLQVNCFSKFLGTFYQSFFIEIFYDEPMEKYNPKRIMFYGDSLTRGTAGGGAYSYPWHLQKLIGNGFQSENRGAGGETVPAIITRTGASPIIVTSDFVLPADTTPVQLGQTLTTMFGNKSFVFAQGGNIEKMMVNPCWVKGVECFIDYVDGVYKINRLEAGDEVKVPAGTSIYCGDRERYDNISYAVLFAGTNGGYSSAIELADMLEKTGEYMDVPYIVLNFWATGNLPQGVTISDIQTEFRNRFGGRFLDIMLYFSTAAIYDAINQNLVEIDEPTQADLNNMAQGLPAASLLLQDNLHLNDAGKILLAQQVYSVLKMYGIDSN